MCVFARVCVSYWSIHLGCQARGSSTEACTCHRPDPPHGGDTHTGPETEKPTNQPQRQSVCACASASAWLTTGGGTWYCTEPTGLQEPAARRAQRCFQHNGDRDTQLCTLLLPPPASSYSMHKNSKQRIPRLTCFICYSQVTARFQGKYGTRAFGSVKGFSSSEPHQPG